MAEAKKANSAPSKAVTAVKKEENAKLSFPKRVGKWFREMKSELKKVIWPTRQTLTKNCLIALGMMVASAVVIWGFDSLAKLLVQAIFTVVG